LIYINFIYCLFLNSQTDAFEQRFAVKRSLSVRHLKPDSTKSVHYYSFLGSAWKCMDRQTASQITERSNETFQGVVLTA